MQLTFFKLGKQTANIRSCNSCEVNTADVKNRGLAHSPFSKMLADSSNSIDKLSTSLTTGFSPANMSDRESISLPMLVAHSAAEAKSDRFNTSDLLSGEGRPKLLDNLSLCRMCVRVGLVKCAID